MDRWIGRLVDRSTIDSWASRATRLARYTPQCRFPHIPDTLSLYTRRELAARAAAARHPLSARAQARAKRNRQRRADVDFMGSPGVALPPAVRAADALAIAIKGHWRTVLGDNGRCNELYLATFSPARPLPSLPHASRPRRRSLPHSHITRGLTHSYNTGTHHGARCIDHASTFSVLLLRKELYHAFTSQRAVINHYTDSALQCRQRERG